MKNMKFFSLFLLTLAVIIPLKSQADEGGEPFRMEDLIPNIKKSLSLPPNMQVSISSITDSPLPGIYQGVLDLKSESSSGKLSVFFSTNARYYIVGNLFDRNVDMDSVRMGALDLKGSPSKGNPGSPVTIVEFSDLQCPSCKKAYEAMEGDRILEIYDQKVRLVYKYFPLIKYHTWALDAALACACADKQDHKFFWKLHDNIYSQQDQITAANLRQKLMEIGSASGLNMKKFTECLDSRSAMDKVTADMAEGSKLGVSTTPTYFINGRGLAGYPGSAQFRQVLDELLRKN